MAAVVAQLLRSMVPAGLRVSQDEVVQALNGLAGWSSDGPLEVGWRKVTPLQLASDTKWEATQRPTVVAHCFFCWAAGLIRFVSFSHHVRRA